MKNSIKIAVFMLIFALLLSFAACSDNKDGESEQTPENLENNSGTQTPTEPPHTHSYGTAVTTKAATYNAAGETTATCSCGATKKETISSLIPTTAVVADGIAVVKNSSSQAYDFNIGAVGNVSLFGYTGSADAQYSGKYRYDSASDSLRFYRRTSGKLLMEANEYIYTQGDTRMKVKTTTTGQVKKVELAPKTDDELNMLNLPFIKLVHALGADNMSAITKNASGAYKFKTTIQITSSFSPVNKLLSAVSKLGENITIKNVTFSNPQNGITLLFNVNDEGVLTDFTYDFEVSFPISSASATLKLTYTQTASSTAINMPNVSAFVSDASTLSTAINNVSSAINAVKNSDTYSLDMTAVNDFDAGWNRKAIVDKYIGRMYKNVNEGRTDFNHSYKYKAHTEEDGQEGFAYTVGNIQDGTVYEIGRKGRNTQVSLDGVTVDTRFAIMTGMAMLTASDVDFVSQKTNADGSVTYTFFTKNSATYALQQQIADLINSNTGEGVVPVENYFDSEDYKIVSADFTATVKNGKLVSFNADIEMKYTPTGGSYTDSRVTLKNTVALTVNENLDKASEYSAPKNVETKLLSLGLNNSKYYIL